VAEALGGDEISAIGDGKGGGGEGAMGDGVAEDGESAGELRFLMVESGTRERCC
jgi:hypothetical protein